MNGILYFTIPDHVFAISARTGEHFWQYDFEDKGGHLVGQRGVGMYGNWLYFMTPDGWFISLNAKDGKERWRKKVADEKLQYFTTMAPMIVKNHVSSASAATPWTCAAIWNPAIPKPANCSGGGGASRRSRAIPGSETWPNQAPWITAADDLAARHLRSGSEPALLGHRQRQSRFSPDRAVKARISTPPQSWR